MTDQELKDLVASLAIAQQKTDVQLAKTDAQLAKTSKKIDRLGELLGNMANNQGDIAEEFFYRSFKKNPILNGIKFDNVTRHLKNCIAGIEDEYDIVLINGNSVAIIEVKAKAHKNDLEKMMTKKVINFPILFSHYKNYQLYAGVATLVTNVELIEKAQELGLFLITQQGKHAEIVNNGRLLH
jgi:hypothetical protein